MLLAHDMEKLNESQDSPALRASRLKSQLLLDKLCLPHVLNRHTKCPSVTRDPISDKLGARDYFVRQLLVAECLSTFDLLRSRSSQPDRSSSTKS